jgi:hypothetical protein
MKRTYSITDLDGCAQMLRDNAAGSFTSEDFGANNPESFISVGQVKNLIAHTSLGKDESGQYIIDDEVFNSTYDEVCNMIFGVGLSKLASKGHLDVSFNSEINEFEFSLSEEGAKELKRVRSLSKNIVKPKKKSRKKKKDVDNEEG